MEVAENIWYASGGSRWWTDWKLGRAAVNSWMNSPGHRANLLNPNWRCLGVGVSSRRGRTYATQKFGSRRSDTGKPWRPYKRRSDHPGRVWAVVFLIMALVLGLVLASQIWPGLLG